MTEEITMHDIQEVKQREKEVDKKAKQVDKQVKAIEKKEKAIDKKVEEIKELTHKQKIALKTKQTAKEFNQEFKKSTNTAIVAAFSFLMGLVWRDLITEYVDKLTSVSPVHGKLITALIVTFIAVIGIFLSTKIFAQKK